MTARNGVLAILFSAFMATGVAAQVPPAPNKPLEGDYRSPKGSVVRVVWLDGAFYMLKSNLPWEGIGLLDGTRFIGVFHSTPADTGKPVSGNLVVDFRDPDHPSVTRTVNGRSEATIWTRVPPAAPAVAAPLQTMAPGQTLTSAPAQAATPVQPMPAQAATPGQAHDPDHPAFGEYVSVEELPEAITKVQPEVPECVRNGPVHGSVVIQVLVGRDGSVTDTKIVRTPGTCLNEPALAAVRQWKFKPGMTKGQPVAVWVAVPMEFKK